MDSLEYMSKSERQAFMRLRRDHPEIDNDTLAAVASDDDEREIEELISPLCG